MDFCQGFDPEWEKRLLMDGRKKRRRPASLSLSELMTLGVLFHQLRYRQFKRFYFDGPRTGQEYAPAGRLLTSWLGRGPQRGKSGNGLVGDDRGPGRSRVDQRLQACWCNWRLHANRILWT
jgi:hypothetical protein